MWALAGNICGRHIIEHALNSIHEHLCGRPRGHFMFKGMRKSAITIHHIRRFCQEHLISAIVPRPHLNNCNYTLSQIKTAVFG